MRTTRSSGRPQNNRRRSADGAHLVVPEGLSTQKDARLALGTHKVLTTLLPREAQILRLRFGIPDYSAHLEALEHFALSRAETRDALEEVKSLTPELLSHLRQHEEDLEKVPWDVFEHLIAEFMASWGYHDVRLVGRDKTTQADVIAVHDLRPAGIRLRFFVEVKRTRDRIGIEVINQVHGAFALEQPKHGWSIAMIVSLAGFKTTQRFSRAELEARNLCLKDGADVLKWLRSYRFAPNGLWLPEPKRGLSNRQKARGSIL